MYLCEISIRIDFWQQLCWLEREKQVVGHRTDHASHLSYVDTVHFSLLTGGDKISSRLAQLVLTLKLLFRQELGEHCLKPVVHGTMGCGQKSFKLVWRCHQLLSGFLVKGQLPRVSQQSHRSLMIKMIMKWSRGCAQISWHFPYSWEKPRKSSARRASADEGAVRPVISSNGVLSFKNVGRIIHHVRK